MDNKIAKFQYITNQWSTLSHEEQTRLVCQSGCKWVQLRVKETGLKEWKIIAKNVKKICREYGATFIMNDNVELAKEISADGVHLGKDDISPGEARKILGEKTIVGSTANSLEDIVKLSNEKIDYIGLGPFQFTNTKKNLSPTLGIDGYERINTNLNKQNINIPIIAIGGITLNDITPILNTGVYGIAVSSLISDNKEPAAITKDVLNTIK